MSAQTENRSLTPALQPVIEDLARFAGQPGITAQMEKLGQELLPRICAENPYAVCDLPFAALDGNPPSGIGSIRIAIFYPGIETKIERHPNSAQYLYSIDGTGETRVMREGQWETDSYGGADNGNTHETRWHFVDRGVWHQSVATGKKPWILAALHTAGDVEDEYKQS